MATLAMAILVFACAAPAHARWLSGDETPGVLNIPPLSPQDSTYRFCQDGVSFQFSDRGIQSEGDHHPHPRPPGSPDSMTYRLVAVSNGPTPSPGTTVADQPLTVPYRQLDVLWNGIGVSHREYSGTFTVNWSLPPGTEVELRIFQGPDQIELMDPVTAVIQNCNLPVQPPDCGEVITKDTTLQGDLVDCIDGIVIGADNITLDLNGHTIDGLGGGTGIDNSASHKGVEIKGGTVQEFDMGINLTGARENKLRNLTLSNNSDGIALLSSDHNLVEKNTASGQQFSGIVLANSDGNRVTQNTSSDNSTGIQLIRSNGNDVAGNTATGNLVGIELSNSDGNRVEKNTASGNGGSGIEVRSEEFFGFPHPTGNRIERNVVSGNSAGIVLELADGNRIIRNTTSGNDFSGIVLDNSTRNRVESNAASGNLTGIQLFSSSNNQVTRNSTLDNSVGIELSESFGSPILDNELERNVATANAEDGIRVSLDADGTILNRNVANQNQDDGIDVENASPSTTLSRNSARDNVDLGIEAPIGVTDGGRNRANGNGNVAQCTGVTCS